MSRGSVNKVILIGNLGADPEIRFTQGQKQVANLSIATSESWTDKNTGQKVEKTEWHKVVFFDRLAEIAGQYLKKGSKVYVEGKLQTRKWQNQQGVDQYTTEIVGNEMQMLDNRGDNANQGGYQPQPQTYQKPAQTYQQQPQTYQQQPQTYQQQPQTYQQQAQPQQNYSAQGLPLNQGFAQPTQSQQAPQNFNDLDDEIPFN